MVHFTVFQMETTYKAYILVIPLLYLEIGYFRKCSFECINAGFSTPGYHFDGGAYETPFLPSKALSIR